MLQSATSRDDSSCRESFRRDTGTILFVMCLVAVYGVGVYHRTAQACVPDLSKDTLWTLRSFVWLPVSEIFRDLGLPNNQPLNTLLIKVSMALFGNQNVAVRLPAYLPGVAIPVVASALAQSIFARRRVTLLTLALCSFNGALVFYSGVARGYSLQTLLLVLFSLAVVRYEQVEERGTTRWASPLWRILLVSCPLAAALTLSPSILFIVPIVSCHLAWIGVRERRRWPGESLRGVFRHGAKQHRDLLLTYAVLAATLLAWYGVNAKTLSVGRGHGTVVMDLGAAAVFAARTMVKLIGAWGVGACCLVPIRPSNRPYGVACVGLAVLVLGSTPILNAGPPRVYIPLIPFFSIAIACGVDSLAYLAERHLPCLGPAIASALVCLVGLTYSGIEKRIAAWQLTLHFRDAWQQMKGAVPDDAFICYPAEAGIMIAYYDPPFGQECTERLPVDACPLVVVEPRRHPQAGGAVVRLEGMSLADWVSATTIPLPRVPPPLTRWLGSMAYSVYSLQPFARLGREMAGPVFAVLDTSSGGVADAMAARLTGNGGSAGRWLVLNPFHRISQADRIVCVLASAAPALSDQEMIEIERASGGALRLFRVCPVTPEGSVRNTGQSSSVSK